MDVGENRIRYSEEFENTKWIKLSGITQTDDDYADPLGGNNAYLLDANGSTNSRVQIPVSLVSGQDYVASVYAKANDARQFAIQIVGAGDYSPRYAAISFIMVAIDSNGVMTHLRSGGTCTPSDILILSVGSSGWYRVSFKFTSDTTSSTPTLRLRPDSTAGANSTYFFGAQLNTDALKPYQKTTNNLSTPITVSLTKSSVTNGAIAAEDYYIKNSNSTITATADTGYVFTGWTGDGSGRTCLVYTSPSPRDS